MGNSYTLLFLLNLSIYSRARLEAADVPNTLHRIVNNKIIRNALDSFTMVRRETYTHTPEFGQSVANIEDDMNIVHDRIHPKDITRTKATDTDTKLKKEYPHRMLNNNKMKNGLTNFAMHVPIVNTFTPKHSKINNNKIVRANIKSKDVNNLFSDIIRNNENSETNHQNTMQKINDFDKKLLPEVNELSNNRQLKERKDENNIFLNKHLKDGDNAKYLPEIRGVLNKQNYLIEALRQAQDSSSEDEHFLDIMESIDKKKKTKAPTTMVMIDQIDVRQALYNDPLVRRILKLAQRKNIQNKA